ncbi:MAG: hypothetical protein ACOWWR_07780 [Eubacteriales bacterium]
MIDTLTQKINLNTLEDSISNLNIVKPSIITEFDDNFSIYRNPIYICLIQINYMDNLGIDEYSIGKIYVSINEKTELSFTNDYMFYAVNFFIESDDSIIHSYNSNGNIICQYTINKDVLYNCISHDIYMIKSTGNIYLPSYKRNDNENLETIRAQWFSTEKLLCYSIKQDGRISFYIRVNIPLEVSINTFQQNN